MGRLGEIHRDEGGITTALLPHDTPPADGPLVGQCGGRPMIYRRVPDRGGSGFQRCSNGILQ